MEELRNPYAAPQAPLQEMVFAERLPLASRATRLGARLLDSLLYLLCVIPGIVVVSMDQAGAQGALGVVGATSVAVAFLGLFIYNLFLLSRDGQTLAKKWLRIRIVRRNGERAGLGRIFALRMLIPGVLGAIPYLGALFSLINALCIFGDEKRCLHDQFADTVVVET